VYHAQHLKKTYKTTMSFLTCWLVIPLLGQKVAFTTLGIASGLFWVVGAMAGIYAIQNAGLALSVGIWCSLAVITSCFFGVFVFEEHVKSLHGMYILIVGFIGMSNYASNHAEKHVTTSKLISKYDEESTLLLDGGSSGEDSDESEYEYAGKESYDNDAHAGYITRRISPIKLPPNKRPNSFHGVVGSDRNHAFTKSPKRLAPIKGHEKKRVFGLRGEIRLTRRQRGKW
jgi:hypothetical protein